MVGCVILGRPLLYVDDMTFLVRARGFAKLMGEMAQMRACAAKWFRANYLVLNENKTVKLNYTSSLLCNREWGVP